MNEEEKIKEEVKKIAEEIIKKQTIKDEKNNEEIKKLEEKKYRELKKELTEEEFSKLDDEIIECVYVGNEHNLIHDILTCFSQVDYDKYRNYESSFFVKDNEFYLEYKYKQGKYALIDVMHINRVVFDIYRYASSVLLIYYRVFTDKIFSNNDDIGA